jgi:hypothetical protein
MKKKNILAIAAIAFFCMAMTSCNKHKSCAAYSKADTAKAEQVES